MQKTVLITGISGGIGQALLKKFADNGYFVIGQFCSNSKKIEELKSTYGDSVIFYQCDFSNVSKTSEFADMVAKNHPNIDTLINNAGISSTSMLCDETESSIQKLLDINLTAPIILSRAISQNMVKNKKGSIVNISSIWGKFGGSCETVYSASKGGLNSFGLALGRELGLSNVRVNNLSCGFVDTAMNGKFSVSDKEDFCSSLALGRICSPDEIADVAYFLSSNEARYVTCQTIGVDGGF